MSIYVRELARFMAAQGCCRVDIFTRQTAETEVHSTELFPNVNLFYVSDGSGARVTDKYTLYDHLNDYTEAIDHLRQDMGASYSLIHSHYWLSGLIGEQLKKRWLCPHIVTFHTLGAAKVRIAGSLPEHHTRIDAEERLIQTCDGVIAPTGAERDRYLTIHQGPPETIHVIPCGVDLELFKPPSPSRQRRRKNSAPRRYRLLFVGRFDPMKGLDTLLHSLALLSSNWPVQLLLVGGDGPESPAYQRIEQLAKELGLDDQVLYQGPVEHRLMPRYYCAADAVVVPSRYESFGLIILEALACGTPVAAMPVGIAPDIIESGSNGYLAEQDDAKSFADAIEKTLLLAENSDPMTIRESAAHYTWSRVAAKLLNVYHHVIMTNPSRPPKGQYEGKS